MNYDSFDNKYFLKGWYFSETYSLFFQIIQTFNPFSIAKTDFGFAATILITLRSNRGFSFGNDSVSF
jgi:NTE family protein